MARRTMATVWLVTVALLAGGCGTAANTVWLIPEEGGKRAYGGVRLDLEQVQNPPTAYPLPDDRLRQLFLAFDLPFSLIGDTLTLPYVVASEQGLFGRRYYNLGPDYCGKVRQGADQQPPGRVPDPGPAWRDDQPPK